MSAYEYTALDQRGWRKNGILEADSARQVRQLLRDQGLTPLSVDALDESATRHGTKRRAGRRINVLDLAMLTRQLAALLQAGLPLEKALQSVAEQNEKPAVKRVLLAIRAKVREGHSFASGLADFPNVFPEIYHKTVEAGEASGHLDEILERLADYSENRHRIRQKTTLAMFYPALLTLTSIGIVVAMLAYVVPQLIKVFDSAGRELPAMTQALIAVSGFLKEYWIALLLALILTVLLITALLRQPAIRALWHRLLLRMPLFGRLTRTLNTARFARTLSILTASNVPILDALRISAEVLANLPMRHAVEQATVKVREGASLSHSLQQAGYFPPMTLNLIASGEASGRLDTMLEQSANIQEREVESYINTLLGLFEPLLILLMGGIVLVIVLSLMLPIFDLNTLIQK